MIGYLILFIFSFIFFLCQNEATSTFGDTDVNNYIYIAKLLSEGKMLYRDIFLDNFPLATYIGFFYRTITFGNMHLFKLTGTLEGLAITWLLYWYFFKKTQSIFIGLLVSFTFCSTLLFLRTALDQSGVYTALLFFTIGYIYWEKKSFIKSGVFVALAVLTKAYFFPLGLALFVATLIQHKNKTLKFTAAGCVTALLVMLPTLLFAFPQFIHQTFHYGLFREVIDPKIDLVRQFYKYDFLIIFLLISAWFLPKKSLSIWLMSLFTPLFFILYKDFYYIYMIMMVFVASLATGTWLEYLQKKEYSKYVFIGYGIILSILLCAHSLTLLNYAAITKTLPDVDALFNVLKKERPDAIYTYSIIGNGIAYVTGIPPYKNHIDITGNQFKSKVLDKKKWTEELVKTRTLILIMAGEQNKMLTLDESIIDLKVLEQAKCKTIYDHPLVKQRGITFKHYLVIKCY